MSTTVRNQRKSSHRPIWSDTRVSGSMYLSLHGPLGTFVPVHLSTPDELWKDESSGHSSKGGIPSHSRGYFTPNTVSSGVTHVDP